MQFSIKLVDSK